MGKEFGYCTNVGKCDIADRRERITVTDRTSLICASCGKAIYVPPPLNSEQSKKVTLLAISALGIAIVGICIALLGRVPPSPAKQPAVAAQTAAPNSGNAPTSSNKAEVIDDLDRIHERRQLRIGVQGDAKPFFYSENSTYHGFNIEFLKLLVRQSEFSSGKNIRISVERKTTTYPEVPKTLVEKNRVGDFEVDIAIDGLTFLDGEEPGVVYTDPYIENFGYCLITLPTKAVKDIEQLKGKRVGVLDGDKDVYEFVKKRLPEAEIVPLSEEPINGERIWIKHFLSKGKVDAVVYDYPFAVAEVEGRGLTIPITKLPGSEIRYKIGLRDGNPKLRAALNAAIESVKASQQYADLLRQYFSSTSAAKVNIAEGSRVYVVTPGDKLYSIAERQLGNGDRYGEIERLNNLPNPNFISVGQRLALPPK